jgi:hypothetical protein
MRLTNELAGIMEEWKVFYGNTELYFISVHGYREEVIHEDSFEICSEEQTVHCTAYKEGTVGTK